jgi:hypothetical protein
MLRLERISKLLAKLERISSALKNFSYKNTKDILDDLAAFEATEKEIQIQEAYLMMEV